MISGWYDLKLFGTTKSVLLIRHHWISLHHPKNQRCHVDLRIMNTFRKDFMPCAHPVDQRYLPDATSPCLTHVGSVNYEAPSLVENSVKSDFFRKDSSVFCPPCTVACTVPSLYVQRGRRKVERSSNFLFSLHTHLGMTGKNVKSEKGH